ncbi:unnamed protein product [Miscanthus lutarioriparius]|uniref:Uncharacterized protein n=1 Tax=Miscanthus lutarioriparius TaxID=422564 RepID=A0A811MLP1_9POAL|nr:unnamed protein product [Miscanthus lutarioriparius]
MATGHEQMGYLLQENQPVPPWAAQTEDEDEVLEISFEEFTGSSALAATLPLPCAAQAQPEDAAISFVQMSEQKVVPADDDGEIEFTLEELMMGSSTPGGYNSMPSPRPLTNDDDDIHGLPCPPMDYVILEALVELGPAAIMEEDFIGDL